MLGATRCGWSAGSASAILRPQIADKARSTEYHADTAVLALADFGDRARDTSKSSPKNTLTTTFARLARDTIDELQDQL